MKRTIAAAAAALTAALLVTSCATDSGGDGPGRGNGGNGDVTISYFTFSAAPDHLAELDAIVAAFEAAHEGITIDVRTAAYGDYFTALQTSVAGGNAPDTFELNYESFVTYARSGALLGLDELAAADPDHDPDRVYPEALTAFQLDGQQYAVPTTFSTVVLFYNRTLFDAAGLDYPDPSWSWADEQAAAQALTDRAAGVYGNYQPVSFHEFYKALAQAGGEFFSADGTEATFNDARGLAAAQWLLDKPGTVMPTVAEIGGTADFDTALFRSGQLAMWHNGIWQISGLAETDGLDFDIVVEPGDAQRANAVFMNATAVSAGTDHAEVAWRWARFLGTSETTVQTRLDASWELPAVNDQAAFDAYLAQAPPENRQAIFDALDAIALPPVIDSQQEQMQDIVTQALERAATGQQDVQAALDEAAGAVTALLR